MKKLICKRLLVSGLAGIMTISCLTGCSGRSGYTKDATEIISLCETVLELDTDFEDSDDIHDYADDIHDAVKDTEVKTDEALEILDDFDDMADLYEDYADYIDKQYNGVLYHDSLYNYFNEDLTDSCETASEAARGNDDLTDITKDISEDLKNFYNSCETARVNDDYLDDLDDEYKEFRAQYKENDKQSDDIDSVTEFRYAVESAVADFMAEGIASSYLVTISCYGTTINVICDSYQELFDQAMSELGLNGASLKSDGWGYFEAQYDTLSFNWTVVIDSGNSNPPYKSLSPAFY